MTRKYLLRLLCFSLLLGALPTVFIGMISYYLATRDIEEKVNEGNMQLLLQTQMRVEQTLKSLEMSATQLANSSVVLSAMNSPLQNEDFVQARQLTTELTNLQSVAVIKQAHLINFQYDWTVSLGTLKRLSELDNRGELQALAAKQTGMFWSTGDGSSAPGTGTRPAGTGKEPDTVSLVLKLPMLTKSSTPKGMLVVQISTADLKEGLAPSSKLGSSYVLDKAGQAFLSSSADKAATAEINGHIAKALQADGRKQGVLRSELEGEEVAVLYRSSGHNGWTYVSIVSIAEMTKATKNIARVTAAACVLILLVVALLAYIGSRRMYSPIRKLLELTQKVEVPGGSHPGTRSDELDYIQASLETLAVSRSRLEEQMQGQVSHLKEFFVLKLFTGQLSDDDFLYRARLYGFPTQWSRLCVLTLQIDNLQETRYQEQDRELLLFAVNNIVGELLPAHSRFSPILLNASQVTLLTADTEEPERLKAYAFQTAELIKSKVEQYLQLQVSIGVSSAFTRPSGTVKAYGESLMALKSRMSLGPDIIVHYEDIEQQGEVEKIVYSHLKVMEDKVIQALRELKSDKALEAFREYLASVLNKDGFTGEHSILFMQLISRIMQMIQEQGVSATRVLDGEKELDKLLKLQTREDILQWFQLRMFEPVVTVLGENADIQYGNIAERMVRIIREQYDCDISLESCAAILNFHPVYLSRVFKKEMGVTFSEYLSEYRMHMGKVMLETTTLKISEIGERLQYKNISAFIRTFRKTFGQTPGKYRESLD
ncbi:helix-turn-helix domain-containing protein [Paenibacillus rigui]|uniref:AraC family transcriptional regulator n=1 Tax=Paenibacillus rigui TaxID=554312 RepID=A0A229UUR7_9BACL|nr:helix-turn-helix domain-containing protein [Paenibacillus rigui]OXM87124.1 AraC family transcriptional regulator [Paenibacillus rigui]